jgi:hypothetical protein
MLREIFMNRMLARQVKLLAFETHTDTPDVLVPLPRVVMKEKKEKSIRRKNVIIYCMLCGICKFIIFVNAGRS